MTHSADVATGPDLRALAVARIARQRLVALAIPAAILAYLVYIFFAFDIAGLANRLRVDNMVTLLSDTWSYKTHVTRDNRSGDVEVAIEGERQGTYPAGEAPDWVSLGSDRTEIVLDDGHVVVFEGADVRYDIPGYGLVTAGHDGRRIVLETPDGSVPDFISASNARVDITTEAGRVSLTRTRNEVFRYFAGWELFFFTLSSPYHGHGPLEILFGDRIDPDRSNIAGAWQDFWGNPMWRHADVVWALGETILMAFLGTMGAALVALPLAFAAARNFAPLVALRFAVRRVFDFARGVDALIWTILLSRAFGPGPLTGTLAILLTDTGTFGKLFSESLENVDGRQIEGVRSTGANALQRSRFGVIPQITPVLISQILYYLESNTRSATIIGAITGGGIGLLLTQAIITQKDWEEVTYYIVLIVLMVMVMDTVSGWLRSRLIRGT
ncbi:phosphonate ABC transporter, permease protein PhnE [Roseivivax isoporae]|uniref:Phosphonate ABC transporter permease n=1 Tax=Roseivivax isoporae LMG 25204 TaxID=1449351 RepID=X7F4L3_9RHOB|nr:phosphonate ABC transporter, permease protein PhnE [Roseivivax isoporae]ETX27755.1 phosphonate ABC transporter permease [Roseivivax isoporae LMG 25204]